MKKIKLGIKNLKSCIGVIWVCKTVSYICVKIDIYIYIYVRVVESYIHLTMYISVVESYIHFPSTNARSKHRVDMCH